MDLCNIISNFNLRAFTLTFISEYYRMLQRKGFIKRSFHSTKVKSIFNTDFFSLFQLRHNLTTSRYFRQLTD